MSDFISKSRLKWEVEKWYEKEYYSSFNSAVYNALLKIIDKFPSAEQEKCGDCISRTELLKKQQIIIDEHGLEHKIVHIGKIIDAPSVEPKRPWGKWIYTENHCWICSECGTNPLKGTGFTPTLDGMRIQWKFCNMCGAQMEVDK